MDLAFPGWGKGSNDQALGLGPPRPPVGCRGQSPMSHIQHFGKGSSLFYVISVEVILHFIAVVRTDNYACTMTAL